MRYGFRFGSMFSMLFCAFYCAPHDVAFAQALPAPSIASFLEQVVLQKITQLQFAANDPRIAATLDAMSAEAESVAGAAVSGASALPWATVLARTAGVLGLLATPTELGDDTLTAWQLNKDGTITVSEVDSGSSSGTGSGTSTGSGSTSTALTAPSGLSALDTSGTYYQSSFGGHTFQASSYEGAYLLYVEYLQVYYNNVAATNGTAVETVIAYDGNGDCSVGSTGNYSCYIQLEYQGATASPQLIGIGTYHGGGTTQCGSGGAEDGVCLDAAAAPVFTGTTDAATAAGSVPAADQSQPLNPAIVADLADALWQTAASQAGYAGVPYPTSDPVTSADVSTAQQSDPSGYPDVSSLTDTVPVSSPDTNPYQLPDPASTSTAASSTSSASSATSASSPSSSTTVDLGPDPGIGSPTLETPPTAAQILAPILGLMSDLKAWAVPSHTSECPEPSFQLWGQTYAFTAQCDLLGQYGSQITVAFEVAFAVAAVLIVLTA